MIITRATMLKLLYQPKKVLLSRGALALLLVSIFVGGVVYIKQRTLQKHSVQQAIGQLRHQGSNYAHNLSELQAHIASLNSRIKHLSIDNKRLSSTGQKLASQLRDASENKQQYLAHTKELQLELYALDQNLIQKYDALIDQQKTVVELKSVCENLKNKDKSSSKKCELYDKNKQQLDSLVSQLKFLKVKRESLLSAIARTSDL